VRVVSIQVGISKNLPYRDGTVASSIFKQPVSSPVFVGLENIEGDCQSDLTVHGGPFQAVYAYPVEHYAFWRHELGRDLPHGAFGENLTTEGLLEAEICSGDRFRIGSVELVATTPRMPCFKLGIRLEESNIVERFIKAQRPGIYFSVAKEGMISPGDKADCVFRQQQSLTMLQLMVAYLGNLEDPRLLTRAASLPSLPPKWQSRLMGKAADTA
jgi:MOSC domain-containing protein YiiM